MDSSPSPSSATPTQTAPTPSTDDPSPSVLQDPLEALDDPKSVDYLADHGEPLIHETGSGPANFDIALSAGTRSISFYVSCAPEADFRVDALDNFYAGTCGPRFRSVGEIPVPQGTSRASVRLGLPDGVEYFVVAFPNN